MHLFTLLGFLFGAGVVAAGLRLAFELAVWGPPTRNGDVLIGLACRRRSEYVRQGREASAEEIADAVENARPAVPRDGETLIRVRTRKETWKRRH